MQNLRDLVTEFTERLTTFVEIQVIDRARTAVDSALNGKGKVRNGRRKPPIQFCPVPGCKNRAAPVFGMVCSDHKNLPKSKIRKYREARRSAKSKAKKRA